MMENASKITGLTRSSSKKLTACPAAMFTVGSTSINTATKKPRVALQLDFDEQSPKTKSPAVKKSKADSFNVETPKSKSKKEKSTLLADVQNLLNLAAKHGCLSYLELPKIDEKKTMDSRGNLRAIVLKQLEDIPGIELKRPVLRRHDSNAATFAIIRPDAPTLTIRESVLARHTKSKTKLRYLIVIDFESTCWETKKYSSSPPEIIEFPAVLINLQTGKIEDHFQQFVMPIEELQLSEFCTNFTGIKQEQVNAGVPLYACLKLFLIWLDSVMAERGMVLYQISKPEAQDLTTPYLAFATWTDWDLKLCLYQECARKNINFPEIFSHWIDLKAAFRQNYGWMPKGLKGAIEDLGLTFEGREHSGLDDAMNTARLAHRMVCDGSVLNHFSEV